MGLRGLWVGGSEGSVGLWLLGVSKVLGSAGTAAWRVWGSGGLLERKCKEMGRTKSAKERLWDHFWSFLGPFWKNRTEKESTGPKRAFRRFSEVPSTTKSTICFWFRLSWRSSGKVSEAFWELFRTILGRVFTIERRKRKRRTSLPLEPARAGSTLARSETDEKATQKRLKTRPR